MGQSGFGRRQFLGLTAAAGAAVAGARLLGEPLAAAASGVDYAGLKRALKGPLLRPGDAGYTAAAKPYNAALGVRRPAAIAKVAGADDVRTCVRRVRGHGVPLAARGGGHSYAGYSTPDNGVVVDLSALKTITVKSDATAVIGAGARLIDVYAALAAHGRALPAGSCPTVGIAGSTLGGGIGVVARAYGLTCDHLKAATVVTADGALHTVDGYNDADLFWALRGGGGGNGGIVTSFTFGTVPAPTVTVFSLHFPASRTARVLRCWSAWMDAAPNQLSSLCAVTAASTPTNRVTGTWTGSSAALAGHLSSLIAAVGAAPTSRTTHAYSYLNAMKYFAGCLDNTITACHAGGPAPFRAASRMLERTVTSSAADRVVSLMSRQNGTVLLFDSLRGQVAGIKTADTAFAHRSAHASVQVYSGNAANGPAVLAVQQALTSTVGTGAYVNYLNPGQRDWASAYYGANLPRLRRVIKKYDPDRVFDFAQSVLRA
ncbi:MAG TPA: FAD-binding oxidoreductase [Pseudonocardiaceae bacterium]|jgi:FAD/FMN-containing dehydrogenase